MMVSAGRRGDMKRGIGASRPVKKPRRAQHFPPQPENLGDRVEIRIRDNGSGIPADVREKMFEPFFTTKPPGEGTGLGLSITHDIIVKQHGGSIEVDTKLGEFTEVRAMLPRAGGLLSE